MPDQRDLAQIFLKHGYSGTKKIGEGSFGVAVLVEDAEGNKAVCKLVDVSKASTKETQEARREGRLLSQVKHPYIVRYRENFAERGWLCIVMDFCDGGDLTAQIDSAKKKQQKFLEPQILRWFTQSTLALKYLHSKHVLHRDLKPGNIFLSKSGDIRLGDFGMSKVMSCTAAFARTFVGTPYYLAPEVISEKPYSWPADIWAMGCILYQMCALRVPFEATNITGLAQKICKTPAPQVSSDYSSAVKDVALEMMQRNPGARPKADAIINKAFIQDVVKALLGEASKKEEKPKAKYEVMDQFQRFDQNGDGVIDRPELARVLKHLDAKVWTDDSIGQIMLVADTNKDGRIQFDEFLQWIFGPGDKDGRAGVASRVDQLITLANLAAEQEDIDDLLEHLLGWRQYVDMGCLRVLPPEVCTKTCEALAWLCISSRTLLEGAPLPKAYNAARQIRAILQVVEQLLAESSRQHVQRVGAVASRTALKGFCMERVDGLRMATSLSEADLSSFTTQWESLRKGERVVEVRGSGLATGTSSGRRPSPEDDNIAASIVLLTNQGRTLEFGSKLGSSQGAAFSFKAKNGEEIEQLKFANKTCTGINAAPVVVNWTPEQVKAVRNSFQTVMESFWPLLLDLGFKMGSKYGNYALLEGRRLGLNLAPPAGEVAVASGAAESPSHWDLAVMGVLGADGVPTKMVAEVNLGQMEVRRLQQLLGATFRPDGAKNEGPAEAVAPTGLELVRASRLQNSQSWSGYAARTAAIKEQVAASKKEGRSVVSLADPMSAAHLDSLGIRLDEDSNCRWLFHGISAEASKRILEAEFDIGTAGAEDGMLYGRGIYLTEWCGQVDRTVLEGAEGLRCMLLCRATLGSVYRDDAMLPDKVNLIHQCTGGEYHSLLGDREERSPGSTRDFVVYDRNQVYPEILLWYRRVYS
mmetsp:Transcript_84232/g.272290  ORF Transcript_84232/g.272290 Transcript_84232/m.272290 type:complete len:924 (-) Transcript_84232:326-3097(-)